MNVAIIPARAGSKGIPYKNLVDLCGKPLVEWTILQALASNLIDQVLVSSDSEVIGRVAKDAGAQWVHRSDENSSDSATTESVLIETLDKQPLDHVKLIVLLQPTSPIRQPGDIDNAIRHLQEHKADSCFSARVIEGYTWLTGDHLIPSYRHRRRRQVETLQSIEENGSIYITRPYILRRDNNRLGGKIVWYQMHPLDSYQIDTPADLEMMRELLPLRLKPFSSTSTACCARTHTANIPSQHHLQTTYAR